MKFRAAAANQVILIAQVTLRGNTQFKVMGRTRIIAGMLGLPWVYTQTKQNTTQSDRILRWYPGSISQGNKHLSERQSGNLATSRQVNYSLLSYIAMPEYAPTEWYVTVPSVTQAGLHLRKPKKTQTLHKTDFGHTGESLFCPYDWSSPKQIFRKSGQRLHKNSAWL